VNSCLAVQWPNNWLRNDITTHTHTLCFVNGWNTSDLAKLYEFQAHRTVWWAIFLVEALRLLLRKTFKAIFTSLKEVLGSVSRYPARMEEEVEDLFPVKLVKPRWVDRLWNLPLLLAKMIP